MSDSEHEQNFVILELRETVPLEEFDHVFMNVQEAVLSHNHETLVVISGREAKDSERLLNL